MATIYLAALGRKGVQEVARHNMQKAHYAASEIAKLPGIGLRFTSPFFNEFVIRTPRPAPEVTKKLLLEKIIPGVALECYYPDLRDCLLVCVTEMTGKEAIDRLVSALSRV
jgi:glycine dehydrogenase subunit 1